MFRQPTGQTTRGPSPARLGLDEVSAQTVDPLSRRRFLAAGVAAGAGLSTAKRADSAGSVIAPDPAAADDSALVAITLALEMSRHYPRWGMTEWDYQKGNLNAETKQYTVDACQQVKAKGGRIHCFAVGSVLEQESVDWLQGIVDAGHPVGNHTYDHVNIIATNLEELQPRFRRAPWLISGRTPAAAIADNIRMCELALKDRLGIEPAGFLAPGNFHHGIADRPDMQRLLLALGYPWAATKYPSLKVKGGNLSAADVDAIVSVQREVQPFIYPSGLVEVSGYPPTDVHAFRTSHWKLDDFLRVIEQNVQWAIKHRAMYKLALHPSIMYVEDPQLSVVNLVWDLVNAAGEQAEIVDLGAFARRAQQRQQAIR